MQTFVGFGCAWNYTIGPALIYEGPSSIDRINTSPLPVVVIADALPVEELGRIDVNRVYGFVIERCARSDPALVFLSNQHRAAVVRAEGIFDAAHEGQTVIVDGVEGRVILDPDGETRAHYETLRRQGPPPRPAGFADELLRDTMDMRGLDPEELKKGFFDFAGIEKAMGMFLKMGAGQVLTKSEVEHLQGMVAGSPYEENVAKNLEKYNEAARRKEEEEKAEAKRKKETEKERRKNRSRQSGRTGRNAGSAAGGGDEPASADPSSTRRRRRNIDPRRRG